jgi:peptide/nickel transport system substrate-binding protein
MCAIMPQRIAETDPFKQATEVVGSGPFRFKLDERVQGALFVYERFDEYQPREGGEASFTAGPKIVHFDRVEWHVLMDPATAAAAMEAGEMDWWAQPAPDLLPLLRRSNIATPFIDPTGWVTLLRPNHLYPPFDKPAVRRALMGAIDQKEFMIATMGEDTSLWSVPCGFFPPISPLASGSGISVLTGKRDYVVAKKALEVAGYQGEKLVLMGVTDNPIYKALADVAADTLKRVGMNVDYQAMNTGTLLQRRASLKPPSEGGWNLFCTAFAGLDCLTPASHLTCAPIATVLSSAGLTIRRSRLARGVVQHPGPGGAEDDRCRHPAPGVPERALLAARDRAVPDGVPPGHHRRAGGVPKILERAPCLTAESAGSG